MSSNETLFAIKDLREKNNDHEPTEIKTEGAETTNV